MKPLINTAMLILFIGVGSLVPLSSSAQNTMGNAPRLITLQQAVDEALKNNGSIKAANYSIDLQNALRRSAVNIDRTNIALTKGQMNSDNSDSYFNITQRLEFPSVYTNQLRLADERIKGSRYQLAVNQLDLANDVKAAYYQLVYFINRRSLFFAQDTLYNNLVKASSVRYRTGESTLLEKTTSETQSLEIKNRIQQNENDVLISQQQLQVLLNTTDNIMVTDTLISKRDIQLPADTAVINNNPLLRYLQQQIEINKKETDVQRAKRLPDFLVGYFNQSFKGIQRFDGVDRKFTAADRFHGFQVGVAIPLLPSGNKARINAAKINEQIAATNLQYEQTNLKGRLNVLLQQYYKQKSALDYYEKTALPQADLIITNADKGFRSGEIPYIQYQQSLAIALKIRTDYVDAVYQFNQVTLTIETILGIK